MKRISMYILLLCTSLTISNISFGMEKWLTGASSFIKQLDSAATLLEEKRNSVKKYLNVVNNFVDVAEAKKILDGYDEKKGINIGDIKKIISCIKTKPIINVFRNQLKIQVIKCLINQFGFTTEEISEIDFELLTQSYNFKTNRFDFNKLRAAVNSELLFLKFKNYLISIAFKQYGLTQEEIDKYIDLDLIYSSFNLRTGKINRKLLAAAFRSDEILNKFLKTFRLQNIINSNELDRSIDIELCTIDKKKLIESIKTKEFAQWLLKLLKLENRTPLAITEEVVDSAKYLIMSEKKQQDNTNHNQTYLDRFKKACGEINPKANIYIQGLIQGAKVTSYAGLGTLGIYALCTNPFGLGTLTIGGSIFAIRFAANKANKYLNDGLEVSNARGKFEYWIFKQAEAILQALFIENVVGDDPELNDLMAEMAKAMNEKASEDEKETAATADSSSSKKSAASDAKRAKARAAAASASSEDSEEEETAATAGPDSAAKRARAKAAKAAAAAAASASATIEDDYENLDE